MRAVQKGGATALTKRRRVGETKMMRRRRCFQSSPPYPLTSIAMRTKMKKEEEVCEEERKGENKKERGKEWSYI